MSKTRNLTFHRTIKDQRGQVLPWMAMTMALLIGMTGFAIDVGHAMLVHTQLQNSSDAAALAGAETLPATTAQSTAMAYSSMAGDKNVGGVYGTTTTTVTVVCLNKLINACPRPTPTPCVSPSRWPCLCTSCASSASAI
jgi:Flp pilus assembly protein TadG